jgi:hypothetical protein
MGGTQIAIGGTPIRGLVLGGSLDTASLISADGSVSEVATRYEFATSQLALVGAYADYYFSAIRGFHVQASLGLAVYVMGQGNPDDPDPGIAAPHAATGFGFSLGGGHEWWIHEDWSAGLMPRLMMGWVKGTDEWGSAFRHRVLGVGLLVSASYH